MSLREPRGEGVADCLLTAILLSQTCVLSRPSLGTLLYYIISQSQKRPSLPTSKELLIAWGLRSSSKKMLRVSTMAISPHPRAPQTLEPVTL